MKKAKLNAKKKRREEEEQAQLRVQGQAQMLLQEQQDAQSAQQKAQNELLKLLQGQKAYRGEPEGQEKAPLPPDAPTEMLLMERTSTAAVDRASFAEAQLESKLKQVAVQAAEHELEKALSHDGAGQGDAGRGNRQLGRPLPTRMRAQELNHGTSPWGSLQARLTNKFTQAATQAMAAELQKPQQLVGAAKVEAKAPTTKLTAAGIYPTPPSVAAARKVAEEERAKAADIRTKRLADQLANQIYHYSQYGQLPGSGRQFYVEPPENVNGGAGEAKIAHEADLEEDENAAVGLHDMEEDQYVAAGWHDMPTEAQLEDYTESHAQPHKPAAKRGFLVPFS